MGLERKIICLDDEEYVDQAALNGQKGKQILAQSSRRPVSVPVPEPTPEPIQPLLPPLYVEEDNYGPDEDDDDDATDDAPSSFNSWFNMSDDVSSSVAQMAQQDGAALNRTQTHFGFIITRHVNSESTNRYWNQSVKLLRTLYPAAKIVIIDDNSDSKYVVAEREYRNLEVVKSEYPGRGELLPYVYYLRNPQWFKNAIILHDSVFIHKRIPFYNLNVGVMPLWHADYDQENLPNLLRIASYLRNSNIIKRQMVKTEPMVLGMPMRKGGGGILCFGGQAYIQHGFLKRIAAKYNIENLVNAVHCRTDRCGLERVLGLIFYTESKTLARGGIRSMFGDIHNQYKSFGYYFDEYIDDFKRRKIPATVVKVWTGR